MTKKDLIKAIKEGALQVGAHYFKLMKADVLEEGAGIEVVIGGYYLDVTDAVAEAEKYACGSAEFDIFEFKVAKYNGKYTGVYCAHHLFFKGM